MAAVTMMRSKLPAPAGISKPSPSNYLDIVVAELFESQPGTVGERPVNARIVRTSRHSRDRMAADTRSRSDFQHAVMLLRLQLLVSKHHERWLMVWPQAMPSALSR